MVIFLLQFVYRRFIRIIYSNAFHGFYYRSSLFDICFSRYNNAFRINIICGIIKKNKYVLYRIHKVNKRV